VRVEKLRQNFTVDIAYRHFPLHPDTPEGGLTLQELFAGRNIDIAAAQSRMKRLMAEEGLPYGERTMTYKSRLAQELAKWAETQPAGENIHDALFQAYFVGNVNLVKIEHLVSIATEIGLPADEARISLEERRYKEEVDSDWQRSRELGITGVPTFVIGNQGLVGAQPYDQLEQFVISNGAARRSSD